MLGLAAGLFDVNPCPLLVVDVQDARVADVNAAARGMRGEHMMPGELLDDVFNVVVDDAFASTITVASYIHEAATAMAVFRGLVQMDDEPAQVAERLICSYRVNGKRHSAAMHVLDVEVRQQNKLLALVALFPLKNKSAAQEAEEGDPVHGTPDKAEAVSSGSSVAAWKQGAFEIYGQPASAKIRPGYAGPWAQLVGGWMVPGVSASTSSQEQSAPVDSARATGTPEKSAQPSPESMAAKADATENSLHVNNFPLLRVVIDAIPDLFLLKDATGRYLACNKAVSEWTDVREEDLVGRVHAKGCPPELCASREAEDARILAGEPKVCAEETVQTPRFGERVYESVKTPFVNDNGKILGIVCISRDITQRKEEERIIQEARRAADLASQAKSSFLANMSHEIRTPLNAIIGLNHLAMRTELTPKQRDYLTKINVSGESLLGLINDILDFSKIESGRMTLEHIPFSLDSVLENVSVLFSSKTAEKGLDFIFDIAPDIPRRLLGDPLRLGQVLNNLVSNAIKFTSDGEIVLACRMVSDQDERALLEFSVRDSGIGMNREQMNKIFSPFTQADNSTTRNFGGTGLGLTITKRFIEAMGGYIDVQSNPGTGSTFRCRVWLDKDMTSGASCTRPVGPVTAQALVACAKESVRKNLVAMLESFRLKVVPVTSPEEARQMMELAEADDEHSGFELAFVDIPKDDDATLAWVAKSQQDAGARVIPIMPAGNAEQAAHAQEMGISVMLPVPFTLSHVADILAGLFSDQLGEREKDGGPFAKTPAFAGERVLVVEDNAINQQIIFELLEEVGLQPVLRDNGQEGLDEVAAHDPDYYRLVLMDLQMPVMDGFTAVEHIRALPGFAALPIVALTAHAMSEERDRCLAHGINDHLAKPIEVPRLYEVLRTWVKHRDKA